MPSVGRGMFGRDINWIYKCLFMKLLFHMCGRKFVAIPYEYLRDDTTIAAAVLPSSMTCENILPSKCISRESNPGHIDGNDVFYH